MKMKVKVSQNAIQVLQYKRKVGELEEENIKMRDQVRTMSISQRQCTTSFYVCLFSALSLSLLCLLVALCLYRFFSHK